MKIVKISSSQGSLGKNLGCEEAPNKILEELDKDFKVDEDWVEIIESNIKAVDRNIFLKAQSLLDENVIFLGGDHSITYPIIRAFSKKYKNGGLIIFDAHPDCQSNFYISHEDLLTAIVNEKLIKPENIILVGIRKWTKEEFEFLKKHNIKYFTTEQFYNNFVETCDIIMGMARNFDKLYISIDIDVIDPAFAPGTSYLEPLGFEPRELIYFLKRLKRLKNLQWVDLVEVNPQKDLNKITTRLAARIIQELSL